MRFADWRISLKVGAGFGVVIVLLVAVVLTAWLAFRTADRDFGRYAALAEIAKNVNLAAAGTKEVSRNISGVSSATLSTAEAASLVLEAADGLGRQEGTLRAAVDGFLERVRQA